MNDTTISISQLASLGAISSVNKPETFSGQFNDFNKWQKDIKFYLSNFDDELEYLTREITPESPLDVKRKSKAVANKIYNLLSSKVQKAFYCTDLNAYTLWTDLTATYVIDESIDELEASARLWHMSPKSYDTMIEFLTEWKLAVATMNTLSLKIEKKVLKYFFIAAVGDGFKNLKQHFSLDYDQLMAKAFQLARQPVKPQIESEQVELSLITAKQKREFQSYEPKRKYNNNSKYFKKQRRDDEHPGQHSSREGEGQSKSESPEFNMVSLSLLSKSDFRMARLTWFYDPCSESSICKFKDMFDLSTYRVVKDPDDCIISGDGMRNKVVGRGDVVLRFGSGFKIRVNDVAHVPKYIANVFKPSNTVDYHFIEKFRKVYMQIVGDDYREVLIGACKSRNIYELDLVDPKFSLISAKHDRSECAEMHSKIGHQNDQVMSHAATDGHRCQNANCPACKKQNLRREIPKNRFNRSVRPLESVHVDLIVKESTGFGGMQYVLTIVDDYSNCFFCFPQKTKTKTETLNTFERWYSMAIGLTKQKKIDVLRSDGGKEFKNSAFEDFCNRNRVWHQMTPRNCSFKNGKVERANQTMHRISNKMLDDCDLSASIWPKSYEMAAFLHNHAPNNALGGKCPWEQFTTYVDRRKQIKFGERVYYLDPTVYKRANSKKPGFFVGYPLSQKGYEVFDYKTQTTVVVDTLVETRQFTRKDIHEMGADGSEKSEAAGSETVWFIKVPAEGQRAETQAEPIALVEQAAGDQDSPLSPNVSVSSRRTVDLDSESFSSGDDQDETLTENPFAHLTLQENQLESTALPERPTESNSVTTPKSYKDILRLEEPEKSAWIASYESELANHQRYATWELVDRPKGAHVIPCYVLFKLKEVNGEQVRKTRIVAGGDQQTEDEFDETFAPTADYDYMRIVMAVMAQRGWREKTADVTAAFLNAPLNATVYMKAPPMLPDSEGKVCKLLKALYGIRQGSNCWFNVFADNMHELGFQASIKCPAIYYRPTTVCMTFVDDFKVYAPTDELIDSVLGRLSVAYEIKQIADSKFLGMDICTSSRGITLSMERYIIEKAVKFDCIEHSQHVTTPIPSNLLKNDKSKKISKITYLELFGVLNHIARVGRPDFASACHLFGTRIEHPTEYWYALMKRGLRYLVKTAKTKILYDRQEQFSLFGYADASFRSLPNGRSRTGYVVLINGTAVMWKTETQELTPNNINEAEIVAGNVCAKKLFFVSQFLSEVFAEEWIPMLFVDNLGVCTTATRGISSKQQSMLGLEEYVRDLRDKQLITLHHVQSKDNTADGLSKPLTSSIAFSTFFYGLGLVDQ